MYQEVLSPPLLLNYVQELFQCALRLQIPNRSHPTHTGNNCKSVAYPLDILVTLTAAAPPPLGFSHLSP